MDVKNESIESWVETMMHTQTQMYAKIEFLEKRIKLLEDPKDLSFDNCPSCGNGILARNNNIAYTTHPAKYEYRCEECGYMEIK